VCMCRQVAGNHEFYNHRDAIGGSDSGSVGYEAVVARIQAVADALPNVTFMHRRAVWVGEAGVVELDTSALGGSPLSRRSTVVGSTAHSSDGAGLHVPPGAGVLVAGCTLWSHVSLDEGKGGGRKEWVDDQIGCRGRKTRR